MDELAAGLAAYLPRRSVAVGQQAQAVQCHTEPAVGGGQRYGWPASEALVPAVVAQNLPSGLGIVPAELLAALQGHVQGAEVVAGGGPCKKARDSVHVELLSPVPLGQLGIWQRDLRERLQQAEGTLRQQADAVELVPGHVELGASQAPAAGTTVVDTDAISILFKGDTRGPPLQALLETQTRKLISFQTVAELHAWILLRHFSATRIAKLEALLEDCEVTWPDNLTCLLWAQLMDYGRAHGRPAGAQDCWVAATALRHGASVCTVNLKDYDYLPGLHFLSPAASVKVASAGDEAPGAAAAAVGETLADETSTTVLPAVVQRLRSGEETLQSLGGRCRVVRSERWPALVLLKAFQQLRGADEVLSECRGIVLDEAEAFKVVAFPYRAFFNANEPKAPTSFDWRTARVYEKSDGSLCTLYWHGGSWKVATQGCPDAASSVTEGEEGPSFAEVFWRTWHSEGYALPEESFCGVCFFFELLASENRVVVPPPDPAQLVLHGARDLTTLAELRPEPLSERLGWRCARALPVPEAGWSLAAVQALAQQLSCTEGEGFVAVDGGFQRLKVKSPRYVLAAHLPRPNWGWSDAVDMTAHDKAVASLVLRGEGDEFCAYFPEWAERFRLWQRRLASLSTRLDEILRGQGPPEEEERLTPVERGLLREVQSSKEPLVWNALAAAPMKGILSWCKRLEAAGGPREAMAGAVAGRVSSGAALPEAVVAPGAAEQAGDLAGARAASFRPLSLAPASGAPASKSAASMQLSLRRWVSAAGLAQAELFHRLVLSMAGLFAITTRRWRTALGLALAGLLRRLFARRRRRPALRQFAEGGALSPAQLAKLCTLEAFLRRLAHSGQKEALVLRGGMLTRQFVRPAVRNADDLDFVAQFPWDGTGLDTERRVRAVLRVSEADGVRFDAGSLQRTVIWEETESPGVRISFPAELGPEQRFEVQIDVAFNDPMQPAPNWLHFTPLQGCAFDVLVVPPEGMFGWKLHGLFERNTTDDCGASVQGKWRPKDLHDLLLLIRSGCLDTKQLLKSIDVAFHSRGCSTDLIQRVVKKNFGSSAGSRTMWKKYREKHVVPDEVPLQLHEAVGAVGDFLKPLVGELASSRGVQHSGKRGAERIAGLREFDDTGMVTKLPGKAHVVKLNLKVTVTEDLTSFGLTTPGSTVRFCGREEEEFEVEAVVAPRRQSKVLPDGNEASWVLKGSLTLKQWPFFTAKECTIQLVSRRMPSASATTAALAVDDGPHAPVSRGPYGEEEETQKSPGWVCAAREALGLATVAPANAQERDVLHGAASRADTRLARRLEVLEPLFPLVYVTSSHAKFAEACQCLAEWKSVLEMAPDLQPPPTRYVPVEELAKVMVRYCCGVTGKACMLDLALLQLDGAEEPLFAPAEGIEAFAAQNEHRRGTLRTVLAYSRDGEVVELFEGCLEGRVAQPHRVDKAEAAWDLIWKPEGYSETLSELGSSSFVVGVRHLPFLELAQTLRGRDYSSIFEVHVTVQAPEGHQDPVHAFREACSTLKAEFGTVKPVIIENNAGEVPQQMMTASHHVGSLPEVHVLAFRLSQALAKLGYRIARTKIEANMSNRGVPVSDEEAARLSPENYFEFHIKLRLPPGFDEPQLRRIVEEQGARLSRSALRTASDGTQQRFVTLRLYGIGRNTALENFEACVEALRKAGFEIAAKIREYAVYDSNVGLDRGWIDAPRGGS